MHLRTEKSILGRDGARARSVGHFGKHARYAKRIWSVGGDCGGGAAVKSDKMLATKGKTVSGTEHQDPVASIYLVECWGIL